MINSFLTRARDPGCLFLFWLAFLLALEPGNILRAMSQGRSLEFHIEALRIWVAALLGCTSAPVLMYLSRRFPFTGAQRGRNLWLHAAGAIAISFSLGAFTALIHGPTRP